MNRIWDGCFWLGLASGLGMGLAGNFALISKDPGAVAQGNSLQSLISTLGFVFLVCGLVLLARAVRYVMKEWSALGPFGRFLGTIGLLASTVLGGYIFQWFVGRQIVDCGKNGAS